MGKEKSILISFLYGAAILGTFFMFKMIFKYVPGVPFIIFAVALLELYVIPNYSKQMYIYTNCADYVNFTRFLPIYNQVMLFTPVLAVAYLINTILLGLSCGLMFLNPSNVTFLGASVAYNWGNGCVVAMLFFLVTYFIIQGLGYIELTGEINRGLKQQALIKRDRAADFAILLIEYILLFIPIFRAISLMMQLGMLNKLVEFNHAVNASDAKLAEGVYVEEGYYEDDDINR